MCFYVRVSRALVGNLARRLWTDCRDWMIITKRRCLYRIRNCFSNYDDVGPDESAVDDSACNQSGLGADIESSPWYMNADRKLAQDLVMAGGDGCFLVRKSSRHPLTLTLAYRNRPYNIPIRKREDNRVALGSRKQNERTFPSVNELIEHYKKDELILFSGGEKTGKVALSSFPSKSEYEKRCKQVPRHVMVHVPN